jgi:hypothetical protein
MKSDTRTVTRSPRRTGQASESPNSNEKISNYLNIWRIAVSSDWLLPCPLKPSEMREEDGKDAAWQTKVEPCG